MLNPGHKVYPYSLHLQISFAGSNGLVAGNEIIDATDGAIGNIRKFFTLPSLKLFKVVFGAPGTLVISNTIISQNRITLGGINMVDFACKGKSLSQIITLLIPYRPRKLFWHSCCPQHSDFSWTVGLFQNRHWPGTFCMVVE